MNAVIIIINIVLIAGAIQGFLFVLFPVISKKKISKTIVFLNTMVFFISANNLQAWLSSSKFAFQGYILSNLEIPWYMLVVPSFFLFLNSYLEQNISKRLLKITLAFFTLQIFLRIILISIGYSSYNNNIINDYTKVEETINALFSVFIFILSIKILFFDFKSYQKAIYFSDLKWLRAFIYLGVFIISFWIFAIAINYYTNNKYQNITYLPLRLFSSLLIYWIGYQGLFRFNLMENRIALKKKLSNSIKNSKPTKQIYKENIEEIEFLNNYIIKSKIFLDPNLSLNDFALKIGKSKNHISNLINTQTNYNFSDYINCFRVNFVKKILVNSEYSNYTVIAIGLEAGFNSKSTFYKAFKKFTGKSPTSYRKENE
ncbi:MAG: helix-turn-helix domain-containing protein [Flavobacteriaceae bacterium]